ncbi:MAG TPA: hypothetical protein DCM87_10665 [Planctomycetes bacterium]|nr:hypothetical protein [Planctomycetota bacterium]
MIRQRLLIEHEGVVRRIRPFEWHEELEADAEIADPGVLGADALVRVDLHEAAGGRGRRLGRVVGRENGERELRNLG